MSKKRSDIQKVASLQMRNRLNNLRDEYGKIEESIFDEAIMDAIEFINVQSNLLEVYLERDEKAEPKYDSVVNCYMCECGESVSIVDSYCRHCGKKLNWD